MTIEEFLKLVAADLTISRIDGKGCSYLEAAIVDAVGPLADGWWCEENPFASREYILGKIKEVLCLNQDN